jgi:hypothetical protein
LHRQFSCPLNSTDWRPREKSSASASIRNSSFFELGAGASASRVPTIVWSNRDSLYADTLNAASH